MMAASVLIAGIGNIFQGDDAFGVAVVQKLAALGLPEHLNVMDVGIRSIDLGFALLDRYDLVILVDATSRGCAPGTLYTIEIQSDDIPDVCDQAVIVNSHSVETVRALSLAKSMGANFNRVLLIGCEPLVVDHDESGHIGLSEVVQAAVDRAVDNIRQLVQEFTVTTEQEVYSHEHF
jgi:hydrogenase maturation protease